MKILIDYRQQFWLKTTHKEANFDLTLLKQFFEEYFKNIHKFNKHPIVFKLSNGCQSKNVKLLTNQKDKINIPKVKTRTFDLYEWLVDKIKSILKKHIQPIKEDLITKRNLLYKILLMGWTEIIKY